VYIISNANDAFDAYKTSSDLHLSYIYISKKTEDKRKTQLFTLTKIQTFARIVAIFTAQRYASAVLATALCLSVCLSQVEVLRN